MTDSAEPAADLTLLQRLTSPTGRLTWISGFALLIALALWLSFTPGGVLGKADAVGYAVCHRITVRSFAFPDGRQLPMCARCSGTFLGVLIGLLGPGLLLRRRHAGQFPPAVVILPMLMATSLWAFDGANSFAHLLPEGVPRLYDPTNFLRLLTGTLHGITMSSLMLPVANATLWADVTEERTIGSIWQYLLLLAIGGVVMAMVLSGLPIFLFPLAVLSSVGAVAILSTVSTVIVATALGQENRVRTLREALPVILLAVALTISLIGVIDALRFAVFRTWDGFVFPNA
jgi:uncharacterized membrane protein